MFKDTNAAERDRWLAKTLAAIPSGQRLLDAGAGELRNAPLCTHLDYVAQDFGEYDGAGDGQGLQTGRWDNSRLNIVSDITAIPEPDASFDAILCSEVFEHIPDPLAALTEFARLLRPGGTLILTAPFASMVHFAPYHFASGFSRYWYEHHLPIKGFAITELTPNGDWFAYVLQEVKRLGSQERQAGSWSWPLGYGIALLAISYFAIRPKNTNTDLACFGFQCVATRL